MKTSGKNAKIVTVMCIAALMLASIMLIEMPVKAQEYTNLQEGGSQPLPPGVTPDFTVDTHAFLSFRPNPVGVNQLILVNIWIEPPIHVSRYLKGLKVIITDPDGNQRVITMDSYRGDTTAWFEYIVDKVGTWKIKFEFPGAYYPAGNYTVPPGVAVYLPRVIEFKQSCYYKPSSTPEQELVVQQEQVVSWPPSPLPTDYWTRPVAFEHREWWPILGNYPWYGPGGGTLWNELYPNTNPYWSDRYRFIPWVQGPNTAHIVWKRQGAISGIVGGDIPRFEMSTVGGAPTIIYAGRCYQTLTKVMPDGAAKSVWQCYDLRTGEIYWERTGVTQVPTAIEYDPGVGEVPGAAGRAFAEIGYVNLLYIGGGRLIKYSPWTGEVTGNYSIAPLTTGLYYRNLYALSVQDLGAAAAPNRYRLINWTTAGEPAAMGARSRAPKVISNTTYARSSIPTLQDWNTGLGATYEDITPPAMGVAYGTIVRGYNLKTGIELWNVTLPGERMYSGSCNIADHGKVAILFEGGYYKAWNLADGSLAWTSEKMAYPWGEAAFGSYSVQSAYGLLYRQSYDGIYAFNWTNGKIVWKYTVPANPFETPYIDENGQTVYSFMNGAFIADGKMYVMNSEHTPTPPITRGWGLHCINATTGKGIWNISGIWAWSSSAFPGAIADGYLVASSSDGYMYVFGKGKSQTTVMVSQDVVAKGSKALIKGTVLDLSPAQPGTPCVAKESMTDWMEFLHKQQSCPSDVKGVPVVLTAIKDDGKVIDLGTVTTNGFYGTFSFAWTPEEEGTYTIVASFAGDDSYGSSSAATVITVGPAPEEPEMPEIPTPIDYTPTLIALAIAIIVVAILVVYAIISIRKITRK